MEANLPQNNRPATPSPQDMAFQPLASQLSYPFDYETQRALDEYLGASQAYPVGSAFISFVSTNPRNLLGYGTWVAAAEGYALVGFKSGDADFGAAGIVAAGAKTHTLTTSEIPAHTHGVDYWANPGGTASIQGANLNASAGQQASASTGGGASHNNIQPSFVVYIWQRTA